MIVFYCAAAVGSDVYASGVDVLLVGASAYLVYHVQAAVNINKKEECLSIVLKKIEIYFTIQESYQVRQFRKYPNYY